ncbi:MAG: AAA family ATPase [Sarcina sp.]
MIKLIVKNIGAISESEIIFGAVNSIVGMNNLGKSTINKILYAMTKTVKGEYFNQGYTSYFEYRIKEKVKKEKLNFNDEDIEIIINNLYHDEFYRRENDKIGLARSMNYGEDYNEIVKYIQSNEIKNIDEIIYSNLFVKYMIDTLGNDFLRKGTTDATIKLYVDEILVFDFNIVKREIKKVVIDIKKYPFKDATIVESPDILSLSEIWANVKSSMISVEDRYNTSFVKDTTKDLIKKLMVNTERETLDGISYQYAKEDNSNIKDYGNIKFSKGQLTYAYKNENISIKLVGDGFRKMSIITKLIDSDVLKKNTLLLIEEPENGMHPALQLEYMRVLNSLIEMGVRIVQTTHSVLMIQAINNYIEDKKFFIAQCNDEEVSVLSQGGTNIHENKNLNEVIEGLMSY